MIVFAEDAIANARDEIVDDVSQGARDHFDHACQRPPASADAPQNVDECVRTDQERSCACKHDNAIG